MTLYNRNIWRKTCPRVIFSTTNLIQNAKGSNLGLHSVKPVTDYLSYSTATN